MKILMLGGSRYLGKEILILLQKYAKYSLISVTRSKINLNNVKHFLGDRKKINTLKKIIKLEKPDCIVDMICFDKTDAKNIIKLNQDGYFYNIKHYIMISSFFLYNYTNKFEKKINFDFSKIKDNYTKNKAEAENVLCNNEIFNKTSIVRLPYIFSFDDYTQRFQEFCRLSLFSSENDFDDKYSISMISKSSAAKALVKLINTRPIGIVDIANKGCLTQKELFLIVKKIKNNEKLKKLLPRNKSIYFIPKKNLCLSSKKIKIQTHLTLELIKEVKKLILTIK